MRPTHSIDVKRGFTTEARRTRRRQDREDRDHPILSSPCPPCLRGESVNPLFQAGPLPTPRVTSKMSGPSRTALLPLGVVALVAARKRSRAKYDTYECGVLTHGETWIRFRIQYYIYALLFVVFDIETVFLYPWAVSYGSLKGAYALIEMIVFWS